ncbi:MAG: tetratricopeptide repeat protein [Bacteroidales bacterium]|nr:tetratricopeptide repeat protein [Bacteroidales bacterium]
MSQTPNQAEKDLEHVAQALSRSEQFIEKNQKSLLIGLGIIILLVVAVIGIYRGYIIPKEKEAEVAIFKGQQYFAKDSLQLALKGNGTDYIGFEEIINQYGSTPTGKLASAYAGICYYRMGETEKAIDFLKKFNPDDIIAAPAIKGLIGDCYVDAGKLKEGVRYFEEAAKDADNPAISPYMLKKAGTVYMSEKDYASALKCYQTIKDKYYQSADAADIDKYIEEVNLLSNAK